jgi:heterodisulfide reductase subunit B
MNKYLFYPGCSLQKSAKPYMDSIQAIQPVLEMEIEEVEDWNCCGATEYMAVHRMASQALVGRNLALAQQQTNGTNTLMAACSACYMNLAKAEHYMQKNEQLSTLVNDALAAGGLHYDPGALNVRHLLDVVYNDIGLEKIAQLVKKPLKGLRVAPYYGCMIVRPDPFNRFQSTEYPRGMDKLLRVLGAEVIDFPLKTHCCSGHMTQISPDVAYELIRRLVEGAEGYKADMMVTLCPMCQLNLDAYQGETNKHFSTNFHMPVLYFTQVMGLAFGIPPEELGIGKEFVDARPALAKIGVEVPVEEAPKRKSSRKKKQEGLPMPRMPKEGSDE